MFHQSKLGRDIESQNTHIFLFRSPKDVLLTNALSKQLGSQLKKWYQDATSVPHGVLLFHLTPKPVDSLKFYSNSGSVRTKLFLPAGKKTKFSDDEYTIRLDSPNISKILLRKSDKKFKLKLGLFKFKIVKL